MFGLPRGAEWIIILLIAFEIVLSLVRGGGH